MFERDSILTYLPHCLRRAMKPSHFGLGVARIQTRSIYHPSQKELDWNFLHANLTTKSQKH
jgi:hypothetical protein